MKYLRHGRGRHWMAHRLLEIAVDVVHVGHSHGVHSLNLAHVIGHGHRIHGRHIDRIGVHGHGVHGGHWRRRRSRRSRRRCHSRRLLLLLLLLLWLLLRTDHQLLLLLLLLLRTHYLLLEYKLKRNGMRQSWFVDSSGSNRVRQPLTYPISLKIGFGNL